MNHEEAILKSLSIPWKIELCNSGETCWCRVIVPNEKIKFSYRINSKEEKTPDMREDTIDYIIPDGSVDKTTAEYIVKLHNQQFH